MEMLQSLHNVYPNLLRTSRLATFEDWPFQSDCSCTPERMAAAGFIHIGRREEPDLVECFVCNKQLDDWNSDDDPWSEHVKHMPSCTYVQIGKQDELDWTIPDLFALMREVAKKSLKRKHDLGVADLKKVAEELADQIPVNQKKGRKSKKSVN